MPLSDSTPAPASASSQTAEAPARSPPWIKFCVRLHRRNSAPGSYEALPSRRSSLGVSRRDCDNRTVRSAADTVRKKRIRMLMV